MTTVIEIKNAIGHLPRKDFDNLASWFGKYEAERWDNEIEQDIDNGLLDSLANEALNDFHNGLCKEL